MTTTSTQIEYFKREAKKLFKQVLAENPEAQERVLNVLKDASGISLMQVQHAIAVEAGFLKWKTCLRHLKWSYAGLLQGARIERLRL